MKTSPAVQALLSARRLQGRQCQPLAPWRLAHAQRRHQRPMAQGFGALREA